MRLDKFLADCGVGTRKQVKDYIRSGRVSAGGVTMRDAAFQLMKNDLSAPDFVQFDGAPVSYQKYSYLMMNKPAGVLSATSDRHEKTVLDLIAPPIPRNLAPVGRLDKDTVGLMLLTNDGALSHRLLSPKNHIPKTYFARVSGSVGEDDIQAFREGISLSDFTCLPAELSVLSSEEVAANPLFETVASNENVLKSSDVLVTIHEGKFHQIKRMFAARGKEVLYLKRLSIGGLSLDKNLAEGDYRELTEDERSLLGVL